ncbi:MAG: hypothetical protein KDB16_12145 [Acidimicrobiales bacterium]|nr:hypothetical protein [Acidimicrobiales bacterium]
MAVIDLDKARAARREARTEAGKDSTQIQLGGQLFTLVDELPYEAVDIFGGSNGPPSMAGLAALILADLDDVDRFTATRPTLPDVEEIMSAVFGVSLGE